MITLLHRYRVILVLILFTILLGACSSRSGLPKILVFSKTAGYHHQSISDGMAAIEKLGNENGFMVDTTTNASMFTEDTLRQYSAVVFLSTTGDALNHYQEADFRRYIEAGGGYMGIHAAADTEYNWGWYGELVGGYFKDHPGINDPNPTVQEGTVQVEDATNPATDFLPDRWDRTDEWYSYKNFSGDVNVLLSLDEDSYKGGTQMGFHPIAWYHNYDGGRAFYTGLGHTKESFSEGNYLNHVLAGIQYAIGENNELDYSEAITRRVPDANRFSKVTLSSGKLYEPTEMTILPNLNVLIAQRRGEILLYDNEDSTLSTAAALDVYYQTDVPNVNAEDGLLGIKADPDFADNHYVYVFYSPADTSVNRLSRYTYKDEKLDLQSENIILEFYTQRQICCHTGGSIAFGSDGLLYLSTGDNSTPFNEPNQKYVSNGFAPLDDRSGHRQYDAQRSAGNPNDLRGKILRIRVYDDGSYDIPKDNLYPKGTKNTRPEIYVQGNRNPYRISVDQKNGFLYWGEVGPDADNDSLSTRGPRGYDEVNQARKAGFFGWPMFVGNNYPYHRYNYATGESGEAFDPQSPMNKSRNNTGIEPLPTAQPAFIWYPYGASAEFPGVGTGGRNAMAGPVYHTGLYPNDTALPEYYDNKLFIYDWIRNWIKVVTMKPNGDFSKMEPFMKDINLHSLIDLEVAPNGQLYLLEYGSGWFSQNDDSGLSRIDFNSGNRAPVAERISVDKKSGNLPLDVVATVEARDPEQDDLTYRWILGDGTTKTTSDPTLAYTYTDIGEYDISVKVEDGNEHSVQSPSVSVYAGNSAPEVKIVIEGNRSFYFPGEAVSYSVDVADKDSDTSNIDFSSVIVSADYVEGRDMAEASKGHKMMTDVMSGKNLIASLNCKACHELDAESIGPSYTAVAKRYRDSTDVSSYLSNKIIKGSSGVWGERAMPAHPDISESDVRKIVTWIQSLEKEKPSQASLPPSGQVEPSVGKKITPNGVLILSASYTDNGNGNAKPLTGNKSIYLRNNTLTFEDAANFKNYTNIIYEGKLRMIVPAEKGSFSLCNKIDLTDIQSIDLISIAQSPIPEKYVFELHLDSPDGPKIGKAVRQGDTGSSDGPIYKPLSIDFNDNMLQGYHDIYITSQPVEEETSGTLVLGSITFNTDP